MSKTEVNATYILGCNTRWPTVREGLWISLSGWVMAATVIAIGLLRPGLDHVDQLLFVGAGMFLAGLALGTLGVALNRSKVNDIIGADVWQKPAPAEGG